MLYWMLYSICHPLTFTSESAKEVVRHLRISRPLQVADRQILTAKLLELQIKGAMMLLFTEMATEVLVGLEHALPPRRSRSSWAICFCVYSILCICIEEVQIAVDAVIVSALCENLDSPLSRTEYCHRLDNEPYKPLVDIFHIVYSTEKANGKSRRGINPIQNGLSVNEEEGINEAEVNLVNEIQCLMQIYCKFPYLKSGERANFHSNGDRRASSRPRF